MSKNAKIIIVLLALLVVVYLMIRVALIFFPANCAKGSIKESLMETIFPASCEGFHDDSNMIPRIEQ